MCLGTLSHILQIRGWDSPKSLLMTFAELMENSTPQICLNRKTENDIAKSMKTTNVTFV